MEFECDFCSWSFCGSLIRLKKLFIQNLESWNKNKTCFVVQSDVSCSIDRSIDRSIGAYNLANATSIHPRLESRWERERERERERRLLRDCNLAATFLKEFAARRTLYSRNFDRRPVINRPYFLLSVSYSQTHTYIDITLKIYEIYMQKGSVWKRKKQLENKMDKLRFNFFFSNIHQKNWLYSILFRN